MTDGSRTFWGNLIKIYASFDILQNSIQISELADRPISNTLLTVRKEFPVDRNQIASATHFSTAIEF